MYTRAHADVHTKEVALYGMLSKVDRIFLGVMEFSWLNVLLDYKLIKYILLVFCLHHFIMDSFKFGSAYPGSFHFFQKRKSYSNFKQQDLGDPILIKCLIVLC